ncbi:fasciculation and elongation protein zeta-2-like [Neodiprion fabricii]|uniref:fasciculation and elongation protein zeta-2-like n=1 Tax=Neodiprion fabricii TaxID=2872261 RepID=UPI001ED955AA|nr:fasciculation and elongation protein zeta-2-like [Neodiprion fabricii]
MKVDEVDEDLCSYLTTVIPYHVDSGPPDDQALQVLIKILKAINEDSPTVPTLLTDYILKDNPEVVFQVFLKIHSLNNITNFNLMIITGP